MDQYISKTVIKDSPTPGTVLIEKLVLPIIEESVPQLVEDYLTENPPSSGGDLQAVTDAGSETSNPLTVTFGGDPAISVLRNVGGEGIVKFYDQVAGFDGNIKLDNNSLTENRTYNLPNNNGEILVVADGSPIIIKNDSGVDVITLNPFNTTFGSPTIDLYSVAHDATSSIKFSSDSSIDTIFSLPKSSGVLISDEGGFDNDLKINDISNGFVGTITTGENLNANRTYELPNIDGHIAIIDGDSVISSVRAIKAGTNNFVLALNGGSNEIFKFTSDSTSLAEVTHNNSAARLYTLPDVPGTVAVIDSSAVITGVGAINAQGPRLGVNFPDGPYGGYTFEGSADPSASSKFISNATTGERVFNLPDLSGTIAVIDSSDQLFLPSGAFTVRLNASDGGFRFSTASEDNQAVFTHANSVNRTYTLPDTSGTLALTSQTPTTILHGSAALTYSTIAANSTEDLTITVTGATVGDMVLVSAPAATYVAGITITAFVSNTDTVTVRIANAASSTSSALPDSTTFSVKVFKF